MTKEEIFEKGKGLIVDKLQVLESDIKMESSFKDDLGADSLDVVELVMELEDAFEIEIPDEAAEEFVTVQNVIDYIHETITVTT